MPDARAAHDADSSGMSWLHSDEVRGLVEEGLEQGYVSGARVAAALSELEVTVEQLDEL